MTKATRTSANATQTPAAPKAPEPVTATELLATMASDVLTAAAEARKLRAQILEGLAAGYGARSVFGFDAANLVKAEAKSVLLAAALGQLLDQAEGDFLEAAGSCRDEGCEHVQRVAERADSARYGMDGDVEALTDAGRTKAYGELRWSVGLFLKSAARRGFADDRAASAAGFLGEMRQAVAIGSFRAEPVERD